MAVNISKPRFYPGKENRELGEYHRWIISMSTAVGPSPPVTLTEVGEQSVVPIMAKVNELERKINEVERKYNRQLAINQELLRKIDCLERDL